MARELCFHVFAFLLTINCAFGLRCYKCDSPVSKTDSCAATPRLAETVDCLEEFKRDRPSNSRPEKWLDMIEMECVKIVIEWEGGDQHISRSCMPKIAGLCATAGDAISKQRNSQDIYTKVKSVKCHECVGDRCNSAAQYGVYTLMGVAMATVTLLL